MSYSPPFLSKFLEPFDHYGGGAGEYYWTAKAFGIPTKDYYWYFPKNLFHGGEIKVLWRWAIFTTESKGYMLKFVYDGKIDEIYGPDYYSRKAYKDLMSLYNNAKKKSK